MTTNGGAAIIPDLGIPPSGGFIPVSAEGAANGVATLDGTANVPAAQLAHAGGGALTFVSGTLAVNTAIALNPGTDLFTPNLAVGTWLIMVTATIQNTSGAAAGDVELTVEPGTATFVQDGIEGVESTIGLNGVDGTVALPLVTVIQVTVAGTIRIHGQAFGGTLQARAADSPITGSATGFVAVKIA